MCLALGPDKHQARVASQSHSHVRARPSTCLKSHCQHRCKVVGTSPSCGVMNHGQQSVSGNGRGTAFECDSADASRVSRVAMRRTALAQSRWHAFTTKSWHTLARKAKGTGLSGCHVMRLLTSTVSCFAAAATDPSPTPSTCTTCISVSKCQITRQFAVLGA